MNTKRMTVGLSVAALAILTAQLSHATIIASDTFGHNNTGVTSVNGTTTEFGGQTWAIEGSGSSVITTVGDSFDGGSGSVKGLALQGDRISFASVTPIAGSVAGASVHAEVKLDGSGNWISLGFNPDGGQMYDNPGPWVLLTGTGLAEVFDGDLAGGPGTYRGAASSTGFTFNSGGYNLLALTYDYASETATVWVNGSAATNMSYFTPSTSTHTAPSSISGAGYYGYNLDSTSRLDAFQVETLIPEPSTALLLGVGGLLMWFKRKRA